MDFEHKSILRVAHDAYSRGGRETLIQTGQFCHYYLIIMKNKIYRVQLAQCHSHNH